MQDKKTFITIIVLLCLFVPMATFGTYKHIKDNPVKRKTSVVDDNPNKDFIYNGKVYFYQGNNLLGTYDCGNCGLVQTIIDDVEYHTNYYRYGDYQISTLLGNNMALFSEGTNINYYNIIGKSVITSYEAIKNYNVENTLSMTLIKQDGKWGALALELFPPINYFNVEYDYLAIPAHFTEGLLDASKLIAKDGDSWQVIDTNNKVLFTSPTEIVDFNNNYYITYDEAYHVVDDTNAEYLADVDKKFVATADDYVVIVVDNNLVIYNDLDGEALKVEPISKYEDLYFKINEENKIEVYVDGKMSKTIDLTSTQSEENPIENVNEPIEIEE